MSLYCTSCGVPFSDHLGLIGTCQKLQKSEKERNQLRQAVMRLQADKAARDANEIPCRCEENKAIILRLQEERDRLRCELDEIKELAGEGGDGTAKECVESAFCEFKEERDRLREKLEEASRLVEEALSQSIVHGPFDQVPCMCDWCVAARKVVGS